MLLVWSSEECGILLGLLGGMFFTDDVISAQECENTVAELAWPRNTLVVEPSKF